MSLHFEIECLCGINRYAVQANKHDAAGSSLTLCHCDSCRYSSGLLCTSYHSIVKPALGDHLRSWKEENGSSRYFCRVCGCHLFCSNHDATTVGESSWGVATGCVKKAEGSGSASFAYAGHSLVTDTKDGGAAVWLTEVHGRRMTVQTAAEEALLVSQTSDGPLSSMDHLYGACACGNVRFHINRPNAASYEAHSTYPDLMLAYKTTPEEKLSNPSREKWWIQGEDRNKYAAGTCACRSCRLFSGFEIQTWAFVPQKNIFVSRISSGQDAGTPTAPLDFSSVPTGMLQSYQSSPGVLREFCPRCGATVFWHNDTRADLVDVSVGLLRAPEGARAETWLQWWTNRVSFEEDTELGRDGAVASTARELIKALEEGLRSWRSGT